MNRPPASTKVSKNVFFLKLSLKSQAIYFFTYLFVCLFVCLFIYLLKNEYVYQQNFTDFHGFTKKLIIARIYKFKMIKKYFKHFPRLYIQKAKCYSG